MDLQSLTLFRSIDQNSLFLSVCLIAMLGLVYLVSRWVTWLGMFVALSFWRCAQASHWTEEARLSWPARRLGASSFVIVVLPLVIVLARDDRRIEVLPAIVTNFLLVAVGFAGVLQTRIGWERRLSPAMAMTPNAAKGIWINHASLTGFSILTGSLLFGLVSRTDSRTSWTVIACGTLGLGAYVTWGWTSLMRWIGVFRPASARLRSIVAQAAESGNLRPRAVEEIALPVANAIAFIGTRSIGVTDATLAITALSRSGDPHCGHAGGMRGPRPACHGRQ
jgi:hypothetical protein